MSTILQQVQIMKTIILLIGSDFSHVKYFSQHRYAPYRKRIIWAQFDIGVQRKNSESFLTDNRDFFVNRSELDILASSCDVKTSFHFSILWHRSVDARTYYETKDKNQHLLTKNTSHTPEHLRSTSRLQSIL